MKQYTETYRFRITLDQWSTLQVLDTYGVNVSRFIREAIADKIKKDWKNIKKKREEQK